MSIRPQYHFRRTATGLDAFNVSRLIQPSRALPTMTINPKTLAELDTNHWYVDTSQQPTPRSVPEHMQLIEQCDLSYPIILDATGRIMDGMHRVCRPVYGGYSRIEAKQFTDDPVPDFVNCSPQDLPYNPALFRL